MIQQKNHVIATFHQKAGDEVTKALILLPILAVVATSASIEIGGREFPYTKPFCAD